MNFKISILEKEKEEILERLTPLHLDIILTLYGYGDYGLTGKQIKKRIEKKYSQIKILYLREVLKHLSEMGIIKYTDAGRRWKLTQLGKKIKEEIEKKLTEEEYIIFLSFLF
jgi:ribosomal protein S19E (S16A)